VTTAPLRIVALAVAALLCACSDIPQPFRHDGPAPALARPRLVRSVVVRPLDESPPAQALAEALVKSFTDRDIPASVRDDVFGADSLEGEVAELPGRIEVLWLLKNADHVTKAAYRQRLPAAGLTGAVSAFAPFADQAVTALTAFADAEVAAPVAAIETRQRPTVRIAPFPALPGDGAAALAQALRNALERRGILVAGESGDYIVEGRITVTPGKAGEDLLKVAWVVKKLDGGQLGVIDQQGPVPKGRLDLPWGALARDVAAGGAIGIAQVLEATMRRPAALQD